MYKINFIGLCTMSAFAFLLSGCNNEQAGKAGASTEASTVATQNTFQSGLSAPLAAMPIKDGGACYLDAINFIPADDTPVVIKAGAPISLGGWAVVDVKSGKLATSFTVQLNAKQPYFVSASAYPRPGLGKALGGSDNLDAGGLKIDGVPANLPVGEYHIWFLSQSGSELLRCDTGRTLQIN